MRSKRSAGRAARGGFAAKVPAILALLLAATIADGVRAADAPAGSRKLVEKDGLVAYISPREAKLAAVTITITAPDASHFETVSESFRKIAGGARTILGFENAAVQSVRIIGQVTGKPARLFTMRKSDGWTLHPLLAADDLAAHPDDPAKPAHVTGVTDEQLAARNLEQVIDACASVIEQQPDEPRFRFALGRALALHGHVDEATEYLADAAEADYAAAYAYLGKIEEDPDAAAEFFEAARERGFKPAGFMLALLRCPHRPVVEQIAEPDFAGYHEPALMSALFRKDVRWLNQRRLENLHFVSGLDRVVQHHASAMHDSNMPLMMAREMQRQIVGDGSTEEQGMRALANMLLMYKDMSEMGPAGVMRAEMEYEQFKEGAELDGARALGELDPDSFRRLYQGAQEFVRNITIAPQDQYLPIHSQEVVAVGWDVLGSLYQVAPADKAVIEEQVQTVMRSDQKILKCVYGPGDGAADTESVTYHFWYEKPPAGIAEMIAAHANHPFAALGAEAVDGPPCCSKDALARRNALQRAVPPALRPVPELLRPPSAPAGAPAGPSGSR